MTDTTVETTATALAAFQVLEDVAYPKQSRIEDEAWGRRGTIPHPLKAPVVKALGKPCPGGVWLSADKRSTGVVSSKVPGSIAHPTECRCNGTGIVPWVSSASDPRMRNLEGCGRLLDVRDFLERNGIKAGTMHLAVLDGDYPGALDALVALVQEVAK